MRAFITKYALTEGIFEIEAEMYSENVIKQVGSVYANFFKNEGKDWHKTKESAIKRAEQMRIMKITSLQNQLQRLQKLNFK